MNIAFFGSSLLSSYRNGAVTYYRGLIRALHARGHCITFYEPDLPERRQHRDIQPPSWARVAVYENEEGALLRQLEEARGADLIVKASGVGVFDTFLEEAVLDLRRPGNLVAFWDVDAPATLDEINANPAHPFYRLIPRFDVVFTSGGGHPVVSDYEALGARQCVPIYSALDPSTHYPVSTDDRLQCDLAFLANRLPDREKRAREFFFEPARRLPGRSFVLGGSGWDDCPASQNIRLLGHVGTRHHNAFNCSAFTVLNVCRASMAKYGTSPATRLFEAAGAGSCVISDDWDGIEEFFEPDYEILVARDGEEVTDHLELLGTKRAREIGNGAFRRVLAHHTYSQRAATVDAILEGWETSEWEPAPTRFRQRDLTLT